MFSFCAVTVCSGSNLNTPVIGGIPQELLARLRDCRSEGEVFVVCANDAAVLAQAEQGIAWRRTAFGRARVAGVAGLSTVEPNNDFTLWVEAVARTLPMMGTVTEVPGEFADERLNAERLVHLIAHALHVPLRGPDGVSAGGIFIASSQPFEPSVASQFKAYAELAGVVAWGWRRKSPLQALADRAERNKRVAQGAAVAAAVAVLAYPVHMSALASAEVTPREPMPVTATQDGVIEKVLVRPNQDVRRGEALLQFDSAVVRNRLEVARSGVSVADAELRRSSGKAFSDEASRAELQTLRARVQEKSAETRYLQELSGRLRVNAPMDGVAVFADAEEWMGRPVQTGERVMVIADPSKVWVTLHLPPEEDIPLGENARVRVNLDISPLKTLNARVVESSYEAVVLPDGKAAFLLRALLEPGAAPPRIGLKGTATVYGDRVLLAYYLFRKPLRAARRLLGM